MSKIYQTSYSSPIGSITICGTDSYLTELFFSDFKERRNYEYEDLSIFKQTKTWLDYYFNGIKQDSIPPIQLINLTVFQTIVLNEILSIPYGKTSTYKNVAAIVAKKMNIKSMSSQAIGYALKNNPIWILIPCHRIIGTKGDLIGYAGGLDRKKFLLKLEGII